MLKSMTSTLHPIWWDGWDGQVREIADFPTHVAELQLPRLFGDSS